ncbi:flagellar M-ring protein FliF [Parasalinivibrio latis]|uniref:flagellar basal-body MS-ring/collar protein FliF n=1 Tax=Parasalinivibrio latis TaxID=2952610 RepID=UPI0030E3AF93
MAQILKQKLANIDGPAAWQRFFSGARLVALLTLIAVAVAVTVVMGLWQGNDEYRPLYGEYEHYDTTQVISVLDQHGLNYYVEPQLGNIMVERSEINEARMAIAAAGIKPEQPEGLSILTKDSSLGTSQFVEVARYRYGLEGELARSIMSIDGVDNARVHLAIPKQTLFVGREKDKPTASVVVSLMPGRSLTAEQVTAIVNLVAGSVPDLSADRVNVIDQHGNLLSQNFGNGAMQGQGGSRYLSYVSNIESDYSESAARMLRPLVGLNNFRVEVAADVNFDKVEATEEAYGPDAKVRSEYSSFDRDANQPAQGVPGSLSNRPPEEKDKKEKQGKMTNERGESSKDYAVDRTLRHITYQQGNVKKLSVSVLLNGKPDAYSTKELDNIKVMLSDALGLDSKRGDKLSVHVYPFNLEKPAALDEKPPWYTDSIWLDYLHYILSAIVALAILFVVVRPALRTLFADSDKGAKPVKGNDSQALLPAAEGVPDTAAPASGSAGQLAPVTSSAMDMPELPSAETGLEAQSSYLQMLSEREPERVAHVVKQWITPKDADN